MKIIKLIIGSLLVMIGTSGLLGGINLNAPHLFNFSIPFIIIGAMFLISADTKTYKNYYSKLKQKEKIKTDGILNTDSVINFLKKFDTQTKELKLVIVGLVFAGIILIGVIVTKISTSNSVAINTVPKLEQSVSSLANETKNENNIVSNNNLFPKKITQSEIQTKNVTNLVRPYYSSGTATVKGASLDSNNEIHITIVLNEQSYKWTIAAVEMLGITETIEGVRLENALECIFNPARNIFKKIPSAKAINLYVVTFTTNRDSYGRKIDEDKTVHCQLYLTKDSVEKFDWSYISTLIGSYKHNEELKGFLDRSNFYTDYFSN